MTDVSLNLTFLTNTYAETWMAPIARDFEQLKLQNGVSVEVDIVATNYARLVSGINDDAVSQSALHDGYVTPSSVAGRVVEYDGWHDLSSFVLESAENTADWTDILPGYRQWVTQYEGRIIMYPLDGDLLSMYYRKDVLEHFGLAVPRTWEEYSSVAEYVHGREFDGQVLHGSCVGRVFHCGGAYWAGLLMSSMTQTHGAWSGHLFDTEGMKPLMGAAFDKALEWSEQQVKHGFSEEFESCVMEGNGIPMRNGSCVLTYNWGNMFKTYLQEQPSRLRGRFGVAPTPGSNKVLDRDTMELVECDSSRCPHGDLYEDIGWVNRAPYMAFGGWVCAVNNYTSAAKKRLAAEFCAFASSREKSIDNIIPNATAPFTGNGQNPYRESHLDLERYVARGYERDTARDYINAVTFGLRSENVVADIRFPQADELLRILEKEFHDYLNLTRFEMIPAADMPARRKHVRDRTETQWLDVITSYNEQRATQLDILEAYRRWRSVESHNFTNDGNDPGSSPSTSAPRTSAPSTPSSDGSNATPSYQSLVLTLNYIMLLLALGFAVLL